MSSLMSCKGEKVSTKRQNVTLEEINCRLRFVDCIVFITEASIFIMVYLSAHTKLGNTLLDRELEICNRRIHTYRQ
jgi:hypothetical protein